jgi:hypothetical protein
VLAALLERCGAADERTPASASAAAAAADRLRGRWVAARVLLRAEGAADVVGWGDTDALP